MLWKTIWFTVALATSVISVAIGIQTVRSMLRTESALAALASRRSDLERKIHRAQQQLALARRRSREPHAPGAAGPSTPGAARPTAGPLALAAPGVNAALSAFAVMANDPKLQGLYFSAERPRSEALYLQLFRDLQLSPAQIARFEDLVMRRREQWLDLVDTMQAEGLAADDPAVVRLQQQIAAEFRAGQLDLLGDAGYAQLEAYERTLPVRQVVHKFAGSLALEGEALTAAQVSQLTQVLAQASPPYQQGGMADPGTVDWTQAVAGSSGVLTPTQQVSFIHVAPQYQIEDDSLDWANPPTPPGVGPPGH